VAETIRLAADAGVVGCTIEDSTGRPERPLYDESLALDRIAAAVKAKSNAQFAFLLTARAHNILYPSPSLDDTSVACRLLNGRAPICCLAPDFLISRPFEQSAWLSQARSISWWG